MKIIIVRHTRVGVPKGTCYGDTDVPLAETFEQEAAETKKNLQKIMEELNIKSFDAVLSSPLSRATKLAEYCGFTPKTDDRLKEYNMGDWEMDNYDRLWKEDPYFKQWLEHYDMLSTPHGENFSEFYKRVTSVFEELKEQKLDHVLIFAHGGVCVCGGIYAGLFDTKSAYQPENMTDYGGIRYIQK